MSTTAATAENLKLKLTRHIKAPRERVFEAWTNPENIMRWFRTDVSHLISAKTDPRVGGEYRFVSNTSGCGGGNSDVNKEIGGVYKEIKKPSKLVFTWRWMNNPRRGDGETTVTIDLAEVQGGTQLTLTHEGFATGESRDGHNQGWNGILDTFERQMEKAAESMKPGNFSWNELMTSATDKAAAFYAKLFGWEPAPMPGMAYTVFKNAGNYAGGMLQAGDGRPTMWVPYVTVADTDASAAAAQKLGAKVCMEPTDIPGVGRIAVITDPTGATFGVWAQAKE